MDITKVNTHYVAYHTYPFRYIYVTDIHSISVYLSIYLMAVCMISTDKVTIFFYISKVVALFFIHLL